MPHSKKQHQLLALLHQLGVIVPLPRSSATAQAQHRLGWPFFTTSDHLGDFHFLPILLHLALGCLRGAVWGAGLASLVLRRGGGGCDWGWCCWANFVPRQVQGGPRRGHGAGPLRPHGSAIAALSFRSQLRPPAGLGESAGWGLSLWFPFCGPVLCVLAVFLS